MKHILLLALLSLVLATPALATPTECVFDITNGSQRLMGKMSFETLAGRVRGGLQLISPSHYSRRYEDVQFFSHNQAEILKMIKTEPVFSHHFKLLGLRIDQVGGAETFAGFLGGWNPPEVSLIRFLDLKGKTLGQSGYVRMIEITCAP